jgi:hypothetical protein
VQPLRFGASRLTDAARRRLAAFSWLNLRSGSRLRDRHGAAFGFPDFQALFLDAVFLLLVQEVEKVAESRREATDGAKGEKDSHGAMLVRKLRAVFTTNL